MNCRKGVRSGSLYPIRVGFGKHVCETCGKPVVFGRDGVWKHKKET